MGIQYKVSSYLSINTVFIVYNWSTYAITCYKKLLFLPYLESHVKPLVPKLTSSILRNFISVLISLQQLTSSYIYLLFLNLLCCRNEAEYWSISSLFLGDVRSEWEPAGGRTHGSPLHNNSCVLEVRLKTRTEAQRNDLWACLCLRYYNTAPTTWRLNVYYHPVSL